MAKHRAKLALSDDASVQFERENNVWFCKRLLEAARKGEVLLYTSALSINECTQVEEGIPVPSQDIQDFFNMLLCSGKSGLVTVSPIQSISVLARNLKWNGKVNLKPMDSLHLASALHMQCAEFITTDSRIFKSRDKLASQKIEIIQASKTKLLPDKYRQEDFLKAGN